MDKYLISLHIENILKLFSEETNDRALLHLQCMKLFGGPTNSPLSKEYEIALDKAISIVEERIVNDLLVGDPY